MVSCQAVLSVCDIIISAPAPSTAECQQCGGCDQAALDTLQTCHIMLGHAQHTATTLQIIIMVMRILKLYIFSDLYNFGSDKKCFDIGFKIMTACMIVSFIF